MDRERSAAFSVLRASSRRLLLFIEREIARSGGTVTLFADELAAVGSVRVVLPGLAELHALGLIDVERYQKRHVCAMSERWRDVVSRHDAIDISDAARVQRSRASETGPAVARAG